MHKLVFDMASNERRLIRDSRLPNIDNLSTLQQSFED